MSRTAPTKPVSYRTNEMQADAARLGWFRADLIRAVRNQAFKSGLAVPSRSQCYGFLDGTNASPKVAKAMATALGKSVDDYIDVGDRQKAREVAA